MSAGKTQLDLGAQRRPQVEEGPADISERKVIDYIPVLYLTLKYT
jgi:hypothetical protein